MGNRLSDYKWQDYVISIGGFFFGVFLIPQLIDSFNGIPMNLVTAGLTTIWIYTFAVTFYTLKLKLSTVSEVFVGTIWLLIFILSLRCR